MVLYVMHMDIPSNLRQGRVQREHKASYQLRGQKVTTKLDKAANSCKEKNE